MAWAIGGCGGERTARDTGAKGTGRSGGNCRAPGEGEGGATEEHVVVKAWFGKGLMLRVELIGRSRPEDGHFSSTVRKKRPRTFKKN
jgi:hypothetical protein